MAGTATTSAAGTFGLSALLTALLALLAIALLVSATIFVTSGGLDQLEQRIQHVRGQLPENVDLPNP